MQRVGGGEPDVAAGLLALHAVDNGREDLVGLLLQHALVDVQADVADRLQRRLLAHLGRGGVRHVGHKHGDLRNRRRNGMIMKPMIWQTTVIRSRNNFP